MNNNLNFISKILNPIIPIALKNNWESRYILMDAIDIAEKKIFKLIEVQIRNYLKYCEDNHIGYKSIETDNVKLYLKFIKKNEK